MKSFWVVTAVVLVTCLLFVAEAGVRGGGSTVVLGMPAINSGTSDPAWITVGGAGVIVLGAGYGVIAFTLYGAGLLFATGQLAVGLFAAGQLVVGVIAYLGQLGLGIAGAGQVAIGVAVVGQGTVGWDGEEFLKRMATDLDDVLAVWRRRGSVTSS